MKANYMTYKSFKQDKYNGIIESKALERVYHTAG